MEIMVSKILVGVNKILIKEDIINNQVGETSQLLVKAGINLKRRRKDGIISNLNTVITNQDGGNSPNNLNKVGITTHNSQTIAVGEINLLSNKIIKRIGEATVVGDIF
jgi:hypothetical protein